MHKKRAPISRRPDLKINEKEKCFSRFKIAVSRMNKGFSRVVPAVPALSRVSQIRCPRTNIFPVKTTALFLYLEPGTLHAHASFAAPFQNSEPR